MDSQDCYFGYWIELVLMTLSTNEIWLVNTVHLHLWKSHLYLVLDLMISNFDDKIWIMSKIMKFTLWWVLAQPHQKELIWNKIVHSDSSWNYELKCSIDLKLGLNHVLTICDDRCKALGLQTKGALVGQDVQQPHWNFHRSLEKVIQFNIRKILHVWIRFVGNFKHWCCL